MNILLVLTGGTIGSKESGGTINVEQTEDYPIVYHYQKEYERTTVFTATAPANLLSENCTNAFWTTLCSSLYAIDFSAYQGVIVTHGSDTLSYSSALLGMVFAHLPIPMVLVAADYPLDNPKSNGLKNFAAAVAFIKTQKTRGVFTAYGSKEITNIHLATRMMESDPYTDLYPSFGGRPFAHYQNGEFTFDTLSIQPTMEELNKEREPVLSASPQFANDILMLRAHPNLDYSRIDLSQKPAAVLHYLYHSGTACTIGENKSILLFIMRCNNKGIPIYLASFKRRNSHYATVREMEKYKIHKLYNISLESAYAKLTIAYNQKETAPQKLMEQNLFFESL